MTHESDYSCPLATVDKRLEVVHKYWHQAEAGYFDPEHFRVSIQTAIQTLRTVTFVLQAHKKIFNDFDAWYDVWQQKLKANPLMRWMVDARNRIEKQGDLETYSMVRAEIVASYYDNGPRMDVRAELFQSPRQLIEDIPSQELKQHVLKDGFLRIQRRWVENSLPDYELLDAVAIAYGTIAKLVADAHKELGLAEPKTMSDDEDHSLGRESRGGRLPCMIGHSDGRTTDIWLATGERMELQRETVAIQEGDAATVAARYGDMSGPFKVGDGGPQAFLKSLFATARRAFEVDGYHLTLIFLLKGGRPIGMSHVNVAEHGEKYLVMRALAHEVKRRGADGVAQISEIWSAEYDPANPFRRVKDAPDKKEFLAATLVTQLGDPIGLVAEIIRKDGVVALDKTVELSGQAPIAFSPIYEAWGKPIPEDWKKY